MKPGWRTTEFWLTLAAVLISAVQASDLCAPDSVWAKVATFALAVLATLGYQASRGIAKKGK